MDDKTELLRLREIADELIYWWDNYEATRAFFPDETTKRLKSIRDRLQRVRSEYREGSEAITHWAYVSQEDQSDV